MNARYLSATAWSVALITALAPPAHAVWSHAGNAVCVAPGAQHDPVTATPYIAWVDERDGVSQVYVTGIDPWRGDLYSSFPADGLHVAPSGFPQDQVAIAASSWDGSAFIAWSEDRGLGTGRDIYLLRVGDPAWPASGLRICGAPGDQTHPRLVLSHPDDIVMWDDARTGDTDIFAMDVGDDGASRPGWPVDGRAMVSNPGPDHLEALLRIYDLGADVFHDVVLWSNSGRIFTQSLQDDGTLLSGPLWPPTGLLLSDSTNVASAPVMLENHIGWDYRYVVAWIEDRGGVPEILAQGVRFSGLTFMPQALEAEADPEARPTGLVWRASSGSALTLLWRDQRADGGDIYSTFFGMPQPGYSFFAASDPYPLLVAPGSQGLPTSPAGGFWADDRSGVSQIFTWFDDPLHPEPNPVAPTHAAQTQPSSSDWVGGIIPEDPPPPVVVWTDMRNVATGPDIYAQNLGPGGPGTTAVGDHLPTRVSLSNARPTPTRDVVSFTLRLPTASAASLDISDVSGRRMRSALHQRLPAGEHTIRWDGLDESGRHVAPGLYWLHGRAGGESISRRIVVISG